MVRGSVTGTGGGATPLVSVVTIFLNAERYLAEAVESVVAQTWPHWELLLVDDGSTDDSSDIAREFEARYPGRIRYLEHPDHANRGMSASRNLGVSRAGGEYVAFLDADDVFEPGKLEHQVALLESKPTVEAVFNDSLLWRTWTADPDVQDHPRYLHITPDRTYEPGELLWSLVQQRSQTPATCSVLVRRATFKRLGGFEESFRGLYEDQVFFYKLFTHCRTHMTSGIFDRYRQHPESHCATAIREGALIVNAACPPRQRFLDWFAGYLRQVGGGDLRLRVMLDIRRWLDRYPGMHRIASRLSSSARRLRARVASRAPNTAASHL